MEKVQEAVVSKMRVLLAERDGNVSKETLQSIRDVGLLVETVQDPKSLLRTLSSSNRPEIALIHADFGGEGCGIELCRQLRSESDSLGTYLIILTNEKPNEVRQQAILEVGDDLLVKPFEYPIIALRLSVARRVVEARAIASDTAAVLDRYTKHIERLAQERAQQLIHADRLTTLGAMAAGVAHEINNPICYMGASLELTKILWKNVEEFLRLYLHDHPESVQELNKVLEKFPQAHDRLRRGIDKVSRISSGLKNFGRKAEERRERCVLSNCINEALELCDGIISKKTTIVCEVPETLPQLVIDRQRIEQVIVNLVVNSAQALGKIADGKIRIAAVQDGEMVELTVEDNGPGIPQDKLSAIWKPFFTTKEVGEGTGLGLAISRQVIVEHGGTIEVENRDQGGACFTILLPVNPQKNTVK